MPPVNAIGNPLACAPRGHIEDSVEAILVNQLVDATIGSLYAFLGRHIAVTPDLRIEGCDGSLALTASWFEANEIEASSGLDWIKSYGPDCNCDCEIYTKLQEEIIENEPDTQKAKGG